MSKQSCRAMPFVEGETEPERRYFKCTECGWISDEPEQQKPFKQWCSECDEYTLCRPIILR